MQILKHILVDKWVISHQVFENIYVNFFSRLLPYASRVLEKTHISFAPFSYVIPPKKKKKRKKNLLVEKAHQSQLKHICYKTVWWKINQSINNQALLRSKWSIVLWKQNNLSRLPRMFGYMKSIFPSFL